jgi:hypothetical protein
MTEKFDSESKPEKSAGTHIGTFADLGLSLLDKGVAQPYNATVGLVAPQLDLSGSYDQTSLAAKAGGLGGAAFDMIALSKVTGFGVGRALGWGERTGLLSTSLAESSTLASTLSMGTAGGLYGGIFTPGTGAERFNNAVVDSATFATMGLASGSIGKLATFGSGGARSFMQDVAVGGLSGLPAGIVNAEVTSLQNHGQLATAQDVTSSALYYGALGALMTGSGRGLADAVKSRNWLTERAESADIVPTAAARAKQFNIPETGNIELGRMMRETAPADQIALVQQVIASRPQVPLGSWMRLIAKEDMPTFLRAGHQMYPENALRNAQYLIDRRNLRPATPDSPPIDFGAWERALSAVKKEANM